MVCIHITEIPLYRKLDVSKFVKNSLVNIKRKINVTTNLISYSMSTSLDLEINLKNISSLRLFFFSFLFLLL